MESPGGSVNRVIRIGIFTSVGVALIVGFSIWVNDHPYWYRPCNEVKIHVDDATGLRRKSPVKTLGLDIGYIKDVSLDEEKVMVKVCVTGPVKLIPETRAFIRSNGFLGDKFLELKPMERVGDSEKHESAPLIPPAKEEEAPAIPTSQRQDQLKNSASAPILDSIRVEQKPLFPWEQEEKKESGSPASILGNTLSYLYSILIPEARAETAQAANTNPTLNASREAELGDTVKKVGKLIDQLTLMVGDLREVTQQKEFKDTVINLNSAMKHLELLLRPEGKVMKNVDSAMESLKNTMANAEKAMKKISDGEGSLGKLVNDPGLYEDLRNAIRSVNLLLGKAGGLKTYVDISAWQIKAYNGARANFSLIVAPNPGRYYLVGLTNDPRGRDRKTVTTTSVDGSRPSVEIKNVNEEKGLRITAMFGKYFGPFDLRVGLLEDYGAVSVGFWFDQSRKYGLRADAYSLGKNQPYTARLSARAEVIPGIYVTGGMDTTQVYLGKKTYFYGVGLFFDDDDIKYLFAFK
jgi:phospholipid/cholesterol/gamma-HCH transport system substrate-binding protein